jgi:hypothetical protein
MRARKLLCALLKAATLCIAPHAYAADHFTPCTDGVNEYYARVETLIRRAAPGNALWKVTVFPSFREEWGIRATQRGDDYELTVVRFDRSIWNSGWVKTGRNEMKHDASIARARAQTTTHKISAHLFNELDAQIRRSIAAARPNDELILDGVIFRFEVAGSGCGEARSFDRETRAGMLALIALQLCNPSDEGEIFRMLDEIKD